jgi:phosphoribosylaminoimidazolecarboxamide formyltransferase/IMP cyclohydrolase
VKFSGILCRNNEKDLKELDERGYSPIDMVVCNLYPFSETISKPGVTLQESIENIDIGGVTLLRAAAKNFDRVTVICNPQDYDDVVTKIKQDKNANGDCLRQLREKLALKAFAQTAAYDDAISAFYREQFGKPSHQVNLRYGMNPHQKPSSAYCRTEPLPFKGIYPINCPKKSTRIR